MTPNHAVQSILHSLAGTIPKTFTGDPAQAQRFLDEFGQLDRANRRHLLVTRPELRVELALTFIRGPTTDPWQRTLRRGHAGELSDESIWDEFFDSFCTAWIDLPTPPPLTATPLSASPPSRPPRSARRSDSPTVPATTHDESYDPPATASDAQRTEEIQVNDLANVPAGGYAELSPRTRTPADEDEDWTLFAPRAPVPAPLTPAAPVPIDSLAHANETSKKRKRSYGIEEEDETRPGKRIHVQLARRSVPLPRKHTFVRRLPVVPPPPVDNSSSFPDSDFDFTPPVATPCSPPPCPPRSPRRSYRPRLTSPPLSVVEDDNTLTEGVKTLDASVFAPDFTISPPSTSKTNSPDPPTPCLKPPIRISTTNIFPHHALEMPRDPDELANHPTNSRRHRNARPQTPAQTTAAPASHHPLHADAAETTPRPRPPDSVVTRNRDRPRLAPLTPADRERCQREERCFRCRQSGHRVATCPRNPRHPRTRQRLVNTSADDATRRPRLAPLTPTEREQRRREGRCFRCRQHGHTAATCLQNAARQPQRQVDTATTQTQSRSQPASDQDEVPTPARTPPTRPSNLRASYNQRHPSDPVTARNRSRPARQAIRPVQHQHRPYATRNRPTPRPTPVHTTPVQPTHEPRNRAPDHPPDDTSNDDLAKSFEDE
ncbi:hypothetical protein EDB83DRAFT_2312924 [Lactarius deliciosus]|nr:hypothetical protein EDB83DRAFT_237697 [Lactarius deliciosus]KAH9073621.1 hypothetical protein EDB83DRAFT_2312924 [Lactarius deliciosus]